MRFDIRRRFRFQCPFLGSGQARFQCGRYELRDLGLDPEDVRQLPIVGLGPEMGIGLRVDELYRHAHGLARSLHASFEDMRHPKFAGDCA